MGMAMGMVTDMMGMVMGTGKMGTASLLPIIFVIPVQAKYPA
jgi:hypothetical protein